MNPVLAAPHRPRASRFASRACWLREDLLDLPSLPHGHTRRRLAPHRAGQRATATRPTSDRATRDAKPNARTPPARPRGPDAPRLGPEENRPAHSPGPTSTDAGQTAVLQSPTFYRRRQRPPPLLREDQQPAAVTRRFRWRLIGDRIASVAPLRLDAIESEQGHRLELHPTCPGVRSEAHRRSSRA